MTEKRIKELLSIGENSAIEFKRCGNCIEEDVYESVCAFANKYGGDILCGVLDDGTVNGIPENAAQDMVKNFGKIISNPNMFSPTLILEPQILKYKNKTIIHIHVPISPEVHSFKKVIFERVGESDVKTVSTSNIVSMYIRKRQIYTEQKVYEYVELSDLRQDLISLCRQRAINKRSDHPWKDLSDIDLLKSAKLYSKDYETGKKGFNLAAILLLGKDDVIGSVCPAYKTDAILRKVNIDRYDDREIIQTNLIESYDKLIEFGHKHLWDKFFIEENQTVSLRDKIIREMISNVLIHREFTSAYVAKFVIEKDKMFVENACRATKQEELTPENFVPISKNPIIASFFTTIGNSDELGSGTRNLFKYSKLYSGQNPIMKEDDIFKITVPLDENYSFDAAIKTSNGQTNTEQKEIYLSENQQKILQEMKNKPSITAVELSAIIGISSRKIENNIKFLRENNFVIRDGVKKKGYWKVLKFPE